MHVKPLLEARFLLHRPGFTLDVDLKLNGQEITVIQGASGSGKTTLLRCMAGLEQASQGVMRVNEAIWEDGSFRLPTYQRPIGYVFQEDSLFDHLTARENILFGCTNRKAIPEHLASYIALLGIEPLLDRKPSTLSGGERQRIAIARAFAVKPQLLLMDEPLTALDPSRRQEVLDLILNIHAIDQTPIIYVTHAEIEAVQLADQLIFMDAGRVTQLGHTKS